MSLQDVIAIALGLAFTYALLSMLASTIKEGIAAKLQWRSKNLRTGLMSMLSDHVPASSTLATLSNRVYGHALVSGISNRLAPSYVPARNFTLALVDVLTNGSRALPVAAVQQAIFDLPEGRLKQALSTFDAEAAGNIDVFKAHVDNWFDDTMDRLSGDYKRWSQLVLLFVGVFLAISLNVDTVRIFSALVHSSEARETLAESAVLAAKADSKSWTSEQTTKAIADLPIPIGWTSCQKAISPPAAAEVVGAELQCSDVFAVGSIVLASEKSLWSVLLVLVGWAITAVAISFGAPFWFDLLNQFVNLRATGPKPKRADALKKQSEKH